MIENFSHSSLASQFWTILEERDPGCCLYVCRIENDKPLRPALWKTERRPSSLEDLRETFGAGEFQIMVRRGNKMVLAGPIGIAARLD